MSNNGKILYLDELIINSYDDSQKRYYQFTDRESAMLLSQVRYFSWATRWINLSQTQNQLEKKTGEIAYNLMNGVDTVPIDCNEVENCLTTSSIIAQMQADILENLLGIQSNDGDIITLQTGVASNQSAITANANNISQNIADIANNTATINNNILNIATNTNNINVNALAITQNQVNIQQNADDIANIDTGGGGGGDYETEVLLVKRVLYDEIKLVDTSSWTFDNLAGYDTLEIEVHGNNTGGVWTQLKMYINDDFTPSNYSAWISSQAVWNDGIIGYLTGKFATMETRSVNKITIGNALDSAVDRTAISYWTTSNSATGAWGTSGVIGWRRENTETINKITLMANANLIETGSRVIITGVKEQEVLVTGVADKWLLTYEGGDHVKNFTEPQVIPYEIASSSLTPTPTIVESQVHTGKCIEFAPTSGTASNNNTPLQVRYHLRDGNDTLVLNDVSFDYYVSDDMASHEIVIRIFDTNWDDPFSPPTFSHVITNLASEQWTSVKLSEISLASFPYVLGSLIIADVDISIKATSAIDASIDNLVWRLDNVKFHIDE